MRASTFAEQIALREVSPDEFVSLFYPDKMGNMANIAYGGCAIAVGAAAAHRTVDPKYRVYSMSGHFLGPAFTDRPLYASVRRVRDTKSFATRQVEIQQDQDKGPRRSCLLFTADFMAREEVSVMTYSAQPALEHSSPEDSLTLEGLRELALRNGVSPAVVETHKVMFGLLPRYADTRGCPEGVMTQTFTGMAQHVKTTQDHLPQVDRLSGDYFKARIPGSAQADQVALLAFILDGALSFLPLTHSKMYLTDVGACSTLDFALRLCVADVSLDDWLYREMRTITAGEGRTYSESNVWDSQGRIVAISNQQSIMRPKPDTKKPNTITTRAAL